VWAAESVSMIRTAIEQLEEQDEEER